MTTIALFFMGTGLRAQTATLSIDEAVKAALENDPGVESAGWDWLAASAKSDAAFYRMFPSLTAGAGYQRLSELPGSSFSLGPLAVEFPSALPDVWTFSVSMQYPVFAGFRIRESAALAECTEQNKLIALEMVKRSLAFEVRRAYWEAVRASSNMKTLEKNLELAVYNQKLLNDQADLGTVTQADLLAADLRRKQAEMDVSDAASMQKRAFLTLASLVGKNSADVKLAADSPDALALFNLSTQPDGPVAFDPGASIDEKKMIQDALARRPETRNGALAVQMAEHSYRLSEAGLYPTLSLTGSYLLGDPNPRVAFQTDPAAFTGTWALGVQLAYDIGGLPANINERTAAERGLARARSDSLKTQKAVILDVQTCILSYTRARRDLELVRGMIDQARENARVMEQRKSAGSASTLDTLTAQLALLRSNFTVTNKDIDLRIAAADLLRATAGGEAGGPAAPGQ